MFSSVILPALVAGAVTLIIEWAAKPRLEARKDRILAASQGRFEVLKACLQMSVKIGILEYNQVGWPEAWGEIQKTKSQAREDLKSLTLHIEEQLPLLYFTDRIETINVITRMSAVARGAAVSGKWHAEVAERVREPLVWTTNLLNRPKWVPGHRRLRREALRALEGAKARMGDAEDGE